MINSKIRQLYNEIVNTFNRYDLPIEVKRLVAENVEFNLQLQSDNVITEELHQEKEEQDEHMAEDIFKNQLGKLPQ